ncbi:DUF1772 domain-containing protein [Streptomyces sp. NPDC008313]|uniref:anthrone oxygenase family protein n=1 Tax=Streptomyces sp. NPDC008313 TaxID=3364826 RepID=UPI0036EC9FF5
MTDSSGKRRGAAGSVLVAATVAMGLIAGAFYVFACAVMPALARSGDRVFIEVMRNINEVIENPVFFAAFFGALVLTALAAWQARATEYRWWVWVALAAYVLAFLLTSGVNVPLNNELADAGSPARVADPAAVRERFEDAWVAWNVVRALLCTVALGCLARALAGYGRAGRGEAGRGEAGRGEAGRGEAGRGEAGRGRDGFGATGYGETGSGRAGYGEAGYGRAGYGEAASGEAGRGPGGAGQASAYLSSAAGSRASR